MWAVLAVIVFLAAQIYLFRSLKTVDGFFARREAPEEKEILSLAFADPATAEQMARLLEAFSRENPEVEMVLHTVPAVPEAVCGGQAAVGFLSDGEVSDYGLSSCYVDFSGLPAQRIVWKTGPQSSCAAAFLRYLRRNGGNPLETVV